MGIGGGIFLIAVGAILAYGMRVEPDWLDLDAVGWVIMLAGAAIIVLTLWFWQDRRRRRAPSIVEETRLVHDPGPVTPDPPETEIPPAP